MDDSSYKYVYEPIMAKVRSEGEGEVWGFAGGALPAGISAEERLRQLAKPAPFAAASRSKQKAGLELIIFSSWLPLPRAPCCR